jgi:hypothetical protein
LLGTDYLSSNYQPKGRSLQQLYDTLNNDMAAAGYGNLTSTQNATVKQWMLSKGYSLVE